MFPNECFEWMLGVTENCINPKSPGYLEFSKNFDVTKLKLLYEKLIQIKAFKDEGKKNRWFGYYQSVGEKIGLWTLDQIKEMVSTEKQPSKFSLGMFSSILCLISSFWIAIIGEEFLKPWAWVIYAAGALTGAFHLYKRRDMSILWMYVVWFIFDIYAVIRLLWL